MASAVTQYSSREALCIFYSLEKFHCYRFAPEVSITDHKVLVAIFMKDVASLSHRLWRALLQIHQYNIWILYKSRRQLFIADLLSRYNHETEMKKYKVCAEWSLQQSCMDIPDCIAGEEMWVAILDDEYFGILSEHVSMAGHQQKFMYRNNSSHTGHWEMRSQL